MSETLSAYTQKGIAAMKAGNYNLARQFFERAIDENPDDETAWLWMSSIVHTPGEKREYLKRVLEINPHNAAAKRGLEVLGPDLGAPSEVMAEPPIEATAPWIAAAAESAPSSARKKEATFRRWELAVLIALAVGAIGVIVLMLIVLATRGQPAPAPVPIALLGASALLTAH